MTHSFMNLFPLSTQMVFVESVKRGNREEKRSPVVHGKLTNGGENKNASQQSKVKSQASLLSFSLV